METKESDYEELVNSFQRSKSEFTRKLEQQRQQYDDKVQFLLQQLRQAENRATNSGSRNSPASIANSPIGFPQQAQPSMSIITASASSSRPNTANSSGTQQMPPRISSNLNYRSGLLENVREYLGNPSGGVGSLPGTPMRSSKSIEKRLSDRDLANTFDVNSGTASIQYPLQGLQHRGSVGGMSPKGNANNGGVVDNQLHQEVIRRWQAEKERRELLEQRNIQLTKELRRFQPIKK